MNAEGLAARIYSEGFRPGDFATLKPGIVIVQPVRVPETVVGLHIPEGVRNAPGTACMLYRVLAASPSRPDGALAVGTGDVVTLRTSQLDPLQPDLNVLAIKAEHILHVFER